MFLLIDPWRLRPQSSVEVLGIRQDTILTVLLDPKWLRKQAVPARKQVAPGRKQGAAAWTQAALCCLCCFCLLMVMLISSAVAVVFGAKARRSKRRRQQQVSDSNNGASHHWVVRGQQVRGPAVSLAVEGERILLRTSGRGWKPHWRKDCNSSMAQPWRWSRDTSAATWDRGA